MSKLNRALIRIDFVNGMTQPELAKKYSCCKDAIYLAVRDLAKAQLDTARAKRDGELIDLYTKEAKTLQEIGDLYGLTRERVRQRLQACGVDKEIGGQSLKTVINKIHKSKDTPKLEVKCFDFYGCSLEFRNKYGRPHDNGTMPNRFRNQKRSAKNRGISWELTYPEWLEIWQQSGHLNERGKGGGKYVMSRMCDMGPYSKENIVIKTHNENSQESRQMDVVRGRWIDSKASGLKLIAEQNNIKLTTLSARIYSLGWPLEKAISTPIKQTNRVYARKAA